MNEGQMFKKAELSMLSGTRYSCPILKKLALSQQIFEKKNHSNSQISNVMKIRTVGAGLFHAVGRMDGQT
jgi:hypothetical protein